MSNTPAWRILVWDVTGAAKTTINGADQVAGFESLAVDGGGSCGEATFTALPSAVDLNPRDVVRVQFSVDGGSTWVSVYQGFIVAAGTSRSPRLQTYRAVGMAQRQYDLVRLAAVAGGDVGAMARQARAVMPNVDYPAEATPDLGFTAGTIYPGTLRFGDVLDMLAAQVGSFIVPPSTSYTYAGRTYEAGETVPAATWGVDADGIFFFGRPTGTPRALSERARRVRVDWTGRTGEQVVDRVVFVYAAGYRGEPIVTLDGEQLTTDAEPHTLAVAQSVGFNQADQVVQLANPIDFMEYTSSAPITDTTGFTVVDAANAWDDDLSTFAEFGTNLTRASSIRGRINGPLGIAEVVVEPGEEGYGDGAAVIIDVAPSNNAMLPSATAPTARYTLPPQPAGSGLVTLQLPVLYPAGTTTGGTTMAIRIIGYSGTKVYRIRLYRPDADLAERVAQGYFVGTLDDVGSINYDGWLPDAADGSTPAARRPQLTLTDVDGDPVDLVVERVETRYTPADGVQTTIAVGQAFAPDQESLRVVLERLARRAVREGTA